MIKEVSSIEIHGGWDITDEKLQEYKSINRNFVVRQNFYNALYSINNKPVCISKFKFQDDENLIIQDFYGEICNIGPMLKEIFMKTRQKFPHVNMYVVIDENGNGKAFEALRKDKITSALKDMYYSVESGRESLFNAQEPIEILMDGVVHTLWAFDGNIKDTMSEFIQIQKEKLENALFTNINVVCANTYQKPSSPPLQSVREPSLTTERKETPRKKRKSKNFIIENDSSKRILRNSDKSKNEDLIVEVKNKRGRPPKK